MYSSRRRLAAVGIVITVIIAVLLCRTAYFQLIRGVELSLVSEEQHEIGLNLVESRGTIFDRNMNRLTDSEECTVYYINKDVIEEKGKSLLKDANAVRIGKSGSKYEIYRSSVPDTEMIGKLTLVYDPLIINAYQRYCDDQPAAHIIGYVSRTDNEGMSGLEKKYQGILSETSKSIKATVDGAANILTAKGAEIEDGKMSGVVTTLDIDIQKFAESILKDDNLSGAIIVSDVRTGELIACASSPAFNPNNIADYISSESRELFNRASQGTYPPGSVFKIVVAAAAIEAGLADLDTEFVCSSYEDLYGVKIKCSSGGSEGHGRIKLRDAFAKSCNCAFIQLGQITGAEKIEEMARKLGLGSDVCSDIDEERTGLVPEAKSIRGAAIGNLSIGQGDLLVTPLQINRMTQIIANGGVREEMILVREVLRADESATAFAQRSSLLRAGDKSYVSTAARKFSFEWESMTSANTRLTWNGEKKISVTKAALNSESVRVISEETANAVMEMMKETAETGTARAVSKFTSLTAAGKTGSAQGISSDGSKTVHAWFTGYISADSPKYAITVFVEDGESGSGTCVPIFGKIVEFINENNLIEKDASAEKDDFETPFSVSDDADAGSSEPPEAI